MGVRARVALGVARCGGVVVAAVVVAGCSGGGFGPGLLPTSTSPTGLPASPTQRPGDAAPAVPEPLDVAGLRHNPCEALTAEQLAGLDIAEPGRMQFDDGDPRCTWHLTSSRLHAVSLRPTSNGLSGVYADRKYQQYFEPTEIAGFPAVYASVLAQRSDGNCELWVGVTDEVTVDITTNFLEVDPCPVTQRVATAMIEHARQGA